MKRLNNKGWGLSVFLIYIAVFFIAIIIITYIANRNGLGADVGANTIIENPFLKTYKQYEITVKESAMVYQERNYPNIKNGDSFYVNIDKLNLSNDITTRCSGYVELGKKDDIYIYNPYIKCGTYKTAGYISDFDK